MAITTAAEYKTHAGIVVTDDDTYIATIVSEAQDLAEDYLGYALDGASRTEYYDGAGSNTIILKARPVVSVTSVTPVYGDSTLGTAWASTDYKIDLDSGILKLTPEAYGRFGGFDRVSFDQGESFDRPQFMVSSAFGDQFRNVKVIYLAGWGSSPYTAAPARLKGALWRIVDAIYLTKAIATGQSEGEQPDIPAVVAKEMKGINLERYYP